MARVWRPVWRSVLGAVARKYQNADPRGGAWTPAQWFLASEQGAWYDPSDLSTMFQDSAGTTPVTAVEQPVGLILDKRLGLVRGPETVGDQSLTGGWWLANPGITVGGGKIAYSAVGNGNALYKSPIPDLVVGKTYEVKLTIANYVEGGVRFEVATGSGPSSSGIFSGNGTHTAIIVPDNQTCYLSARGASTTLDVTNISIKELPGNHAFQATSASRLVLRLDGANYYFALDRVDDHLTVLTGGGGTTGICVCAAIRAGGAGNARTIWSDRGTNTGYRLSINASNQLVLSAGNGSAHTEVIGPTVTAGTDYVVTGWHDGTNLSVQLNAGAATSAAFGTATAGTAGFTIGKDNGAATDYYGDRIYEIVYRKNDTSSAGDRASLITYMAAQAGVTL